jgi:hypothetical protein
MTWQANVAIRSRVLTAALAAIFFPMIAIGDNIRSDNMPLGERISILLDSEIF